MIPSPERNTSANEANKKTRVCPAGLNAASCRAPRIAPLWWDLNPGSTAVLPGGGVFYAADAAQACVVWKGIPQFASTTIFGNFECILSASGQITFYYDTANGLPTVTTVVGLSKGGATNPTNTRNWNVDYAGATILAATGTEQFATGLLDLNNLNGPGLGSTLTLVPAALPTGNVDFAALGIPNYAPCPVGTYPPLAGATTTVVGTGCPAAVPNGSIYELFSLTTGLTPFDLANTGIQFTRAGNNYSLVPGPAFDTSYTTTGTILAGVADDSLSIIPLTMGTFPFGTISTTSITLSSNGYVWVTTGAQEFNASATTFHSAAARISVYWKDLVPNVTTAPIYVENTAGLFRATWQNVPQFSGGGLNNFQLSMFANGDIAIAYGSVTGTVTTSPPLVGISGGTATNLGTYNIATAGVVNPVTRQITGGISPMSYTVNNAPRLGQTFTMTSTVPAPNVGIGGFILGTTNPALPLDSVFGPGSAPGCTFYSDNVFQFFFYNGPNIASFSQTVLVPYDLNLAGLTLQSQAVGFVTGAINAAGLVTSNGRSMTTGL